MTLGLRHSPVQFWLLLGEREDLIIFCYGPQAFFISRELVMYFSISVNKLEKKQEQSSMEMSCNPVFQTLLLVSSSPCSILFYKFSCNLESAWTRQTPFLSWSLTKNCGILWPAVFCGSFKELTLSTELLYGLCLQYVVASALLHYKRHVHLMHLLHDYSELIDTTEATGLWLLLQVKFDQWARLCGDQILGPRFILNLHPALGRASTAPWCSAFHQLTPCSIIHVCCGSFPKPIIFLYILEYIEV